MAGLHRRRQHHPARLDRTPLRTHRALAPYTLCHRSQLTQRLDDLGLTLAPGADLNDLDMRWDVYLNHADPTALKAQLDAART